MGKVMKYYLKRSVMISGASSRSMPWDYPIFIMFTLPDKERINRNYLQAKINGLDPEMRKICATDRCSEGYTYHELMEEIQTSPEISEEEFKVMLSIPHWNPIEILDKRLDAYVEAVKKVTEFNDEDGEEELRNIKNAFVDVVDRENDELPEVEYTREN